MKRWGRRQRWENKRSNAGERRNEKKGEGQREDLEEVRKEREVLAEKVVKLVKMNVSTPPSQQPECLSSWQHVGQRIHQKSLQPGSPIQRIAPAPHFWCGCPSSLPLPKPRATLTASSSRLTTNLLISTLLPRHHPWLQGPELLEKWLPLQCPGQASGQTLCLRLSPVLGCFLSGSGHETTDPCHSSVYHPWSVWMCH